jgi:cytochrome o ubiquinol oxidase subunit 2
MFSSLVSRLDLLTPAGPVGQGELSVMLLTLLLSAVVVVPVFFLLFYFAWRYRASNPHAKGNHAPNWDHDSVLAEVVWWLVPAFIVLVLSSVAWRSSHELDPYRPLSAAQPLTVEVVALDWKWLFIYPAQGVATVNELEFPAGVPVRFVLTADAPMNSFWIPKLGGQIMVMPGMQTQLSLMANAPGTFDGYSANISGDGFAGMAFAAKAVTQADFDAWVAAVQASSTPLSRERYQSLRAPSAYVKPSTYAPVDLRLYTDIIDALMPPQAKRMHTP